MIKKNLVLSFQYHKTRNSYSTTKDNHKYVSDKKRNFEEIFILAISKTDFNARWASVINRKQVSSWGFLKASVEESHYLGVHIAHKDDKLYYIFNTHKDNAELPLKTRNDETWKKKSDSRIMMVEVSGTGVLSSKMLSNWPGSLYFEKNELVLDRKSKLSDARKGSPYFVVEDDGDFKFGYLIF